MRSGRKEQKLYGRGGSGVGRDRGGDRDYFSQYFCFGSKRNRGRYAFACSYERRQSCGESVCGGFRVRHRYNVVFLLVSAARAGDAQQKTDGGASCAVRGCVYPVEVRIEKYSRGGLSRSRRSGNRFFVRVRPCHCKMGQGRTEKSAGESAAVIGFPSGSGGDHLGCLMTIFSASTTRKYMPAARTHKMKVAAITRSSRKTWPPYTIR